MKLKKKNICESDIMQIFVKISNGNPPHVYSYEGRAPSIE